MVGLLSFYNTCSSAAACAPKRQQRTTMPQWRQGAPAIGGHISRENWALGQIELDLARGAIVIEGETYCISHLEGAHELGKFLCVVEFLSIGSRDDIPAK